MLNVEDYLKMSKYNPQFVKEYDYVLLELRAMLDRGEISDVEYTSYVSSLEDHTKSKVSVDIRRGFTRYATLKKEGFYNLNYKDADIKAIVEARQYCKLFLSWVDLSRHKEDNEYVVRYLSRLAANLVKAIKERSEERWDLYVSLKSKAISAVSQGLASRLSMKPIAQVLRIIMTEERNILKSLPDRSELEMNLFDSEANKLSFDLDDRAVDLIFYFLFNLKQFNDLAKETNDTILRDIEHRKISKSSSDKYLSKFYWMSYGFMERTSVSEFSPIMTFYIGDKLGTGPDACLVYTEKQMLRAAEFASGFIDDMSVEFLVDQLIERKLRVDLDSFDVGKEEAKRFYSNALNESLELCREYRLIPLMRYLEYQKRGKEKFR